MAKAPAVHKRRWINMNLTGVRGWFSVIATLCGRHVDHCKRSSVYWANVTCKRCQARKSK